MIHTDGIAEEDSLAENVQRAPLHPSAEEVAAAFVSATVVKQRLRLAPVSPKLLEIYA